MPPLPTSWEFAQALGLCSVALCLILCVLAVRPRSGAARAFSLGAHELLGWVALVTAILHVGVLLAVDPVVVEHVKPTTPRYEYAGAVGLLALLFLTAPAGAAVRSRLWPRHRNFQATHVGIACLLVVALAVHVLSTGRYVRGPAHAVAYVLMSGVALLALLRGCAQRSSAQAPARPLDGLVFGRHSRLVVAVVIASLATLLALVRSSTASAMREPFLRRAEPLVLGFPHDKHRAVNCIECHHNYVDQTGKDSCISCHRARRADLKMGAEARFHGFCLGCHREPPASLTRHGPIAGCKTCHAPLSGSTFGG